MASKRAPSLQVPRYKAQLTVEHMTRWTSVVWLAAAAKYGVGQAASGLQPLSGLLVFICAAIVFAGLLLRPYDRREHERQKQAFEAKLRGLDPMQLDALARVKIQDSSKDQAALGVALLATLGAGWLARSLCTWAELEAGLQQGVPILVAVTGVSLVMVPIHLRQQAAAFDAAEREILGRRTSSSNPFPQPSIQPIGAEVDFDDDLWLEHSQDSDYFGADHPHEENPELRFDSFDGSDATDNREWFEILGVAPNATEQEIKSAWRKAIVEVHPDRFAGKPPGIIEWAEERTKELNAALQAARSSARQAHP